MLCASIVAARILGKTTFGKLGMVRNTFRMLGIFAGLGLGLTATKHVAEFRRQAPERAGRIIALAYAFTTTCAAVIVPVVFVCAPYLASRVINAPDLTFELRIGCGLLLFHALAGVQTSALAGFEAFKTIARVNLLIGLLSFPLLVGGVWFWSLRGAVVASVAAAAVGCLINHIALRRVARKAGVPIRYQGIGSELSVLWRFSVPALLAGVIVAPVMWATRALLVNQPGGYAEMGVFSAAFRFMLIILFVPKLVSRVALPILIDLLSTDQIARYRRLLSRLAAIAPVCCLVLAGPMCLLSRPIMAAYGAGFADGWPVLCVLSAAAVVSVASSVLAQAIVSMGRLWPALLLNLIWAGELLIGVSLLLGLGAMGVALAYLISYALHTVQSAACVMLALRNPRRGSTNEADVLK